MKRPTSSDSPTFHPSSSKRQRTETSPDINEHQVTVTMPPTDQPSCLALVDADRDTLSEDEHKKMDDSVLKAFALNIKYDEPPGWSFLLFNIAANDGRLVRLSSKEAQDLLEKNPPIQDLLAETWKEREWKKVRQLNILWPAVLGHKDVRPWHYPHEQGQEKAVESSWMHQYSGNAAKALWNHVVKHYNNPEGKAYAHFFAIVQSSGMGKSRAVDEMSKEHFVIPLNLRGAGSQGFPPPDHRARDFLAQGNSRGDAYHRAHAFLQSLFEHTTRVLQDMDLQGEEPRKIALQFRFKMTEGQTFHAPNSFRKGFYDVVVGSAERYLANLKVAAEGRGQKAPAYTSPTKKTQTDSFSPTQACQRLANFLRGSSADDREHSPTEEGPRRKRGAAKQSTLPSEPLIVLAADEAHTLTDRRTISEESSREWSSFTELQSILRTLNTTPLFSIFMSTTGKLGQFTPTPENDVSSRLVHRHFNLIVPFVDTGFDTLAERISARDMPDIDHFASDRFIAHLGRPLFGSLYDANDTDESVRTSLIEFAATKLLNAPVTTTPLNPVQCLACLSQRIPIEFHSMSYTAQQQERSLVEGHMRVCLNVDAAFESLVTVSASEPLLSEAAYFIMNRGSFNALEGMKTVFEGFSVDKGLRGEFIVMFMFTLARDKTVGDPGSDGRPPHGRVFALSDFFIGNLFSENKSTDFLDFANDFPESKVHFNHYIKVHELKCVGIAYLRALAARGAGIMCANTQEGVDLIHPFLRSGTEFLLLNLGLILAQIKNDPKYGDKPQEHLFQKMDPVKLGILNPGDAIPIIKIVFALASRTPSLHVKRHPPSTAYNAPVYEIWCAGVSPEFLGVVMKNQEHIWSALLQASHGWKDMYKGGDTVLKQSMNPGAATDNGHWTRWIELKM